MDSKVPETVTSKKLVTPDDFSFPFSPYGIQLEFMKKLYDTIEEKKIGIFESPTGTGKSLSIICGVLTWLKDHEEREIRSVEDALKSIELKSDPGDDWLSAQIKARAVNNIIYELKNQQNKIQSRNNNIKAIRQRVEKKKQNRNVHPKNSNEEESENHNDNLDELDDMLEEFLDNLDEKDSKLEESNEEEVEEELTVTRIIYCSRTHSQLSQFVNEIQKTDFFNDTRLVHLASRQSYCINKKFQNITIGALNEKCLELQAGKEYHTTKKDNEGVSVKKQKSNSGAKCPHMKGISDFSDVILSQIMDVEAVTQESKKVGSCPYYASRTVIPLAQIIVLPYHTLLLKESREATGLMLDDSVIIIDEAHNLLETISHIHSSQIFGQQIILAHSQLSQYRDRYSTKFSAINLLYLNQLIYVIGALIKLLRSGNNSVHSAKGKEETNTELLKVSDFVMSAEIDNYNIHKLLLFCKQTKIYHKLQRFTNKTDSFVNVEQKEKSSGIKELILGIKNNCKSKKSKPQQSEIIVEEVNRNNFEEPVSQPLLQIIGFLTCLTQQYNDGRIVISRHTTLGKSFLKYLLLEPGSSVIDIIKRARSVILAGGTMEPISEFKERLFNVCGVPSNRVEQFSCGHIIPKENILPIVVCTGPTGKQLDFSFHSRSSATMMNEIGRLIINVCNVVPSGVVCFFPSYEYEKEIYEYFEKNGIIKNISLKKQVFREPKKSCEVEKVLSEYATVINKAKELNKVNGALLFSVVGGKLSEGLNFSDDLGRCILIIGMPYPNVKSPELQEKMKYLEEHYGSNAGKVHYENLCMKAVNQSVGRSIRHRNDYSSVLLVDQRYSRPHVCNLLPKWMQGSLKIEREKFGPVLAQLCKFFKFHLVNKK